MRLSRILSNRRKNKRVIRAKQKHKSLDAICETTYTENRVKIESPKLSDVYGDTSEVRRSSRVRRAPLVLDASPSPVKKRRRISEQDGNGSCKRVGGLKTESTGLTTLGLEDEESGEWKSRLRARGRKVSFLVGNSSPKSKKKLFGNSNGVKKQLDVVDSRLEDKKPLMVVQSKQPGGIKASTAVSNGDIGLSNSDEDVEDTTAVQVTVNGAVVESPDVAVSSDSEDTAKNMAQIVQPVEKSSPAEQAESVEKDNNISDQEVTCAPQNHIEDQTVEKSSPAEQAESMEKENKSSHQEVTGNHVEDHTSNANNLQDENPKKLVEDKFFPAHRQHRPRIKQGRCCGLCGGGIDGKPPKKLVNNGAGSDNESYSGSSSSEEPTYDIWDGFGDEPSWLGQLLGPINDRFGIAGIWVHQQCAVWSPEVYFAGLGCLKNVRSALCRGKVLKCSRCGRRGATIGCRVDRCPKTYHLPCARAIGCIFDHRKFLIACTDHRHLFQPHGSKYFDRLKKIKTKKMKLEFRKLSTDAWRKDHEAEEKWLENCGEDEEFLKRESKRLGRDLTRIAPVYIGGPGPGPTSENQIPYQGWESVGGLKDVIQSLKEVVILPLLYPEFFNNIGLTPPRGVLLHGYPGTGKTLIVRSLIGSCARGDKRIAYFARKGADCLGKYVGDAERQLRLLFQVAEKSQPSIIFFDEIDGLAPSRTRQQDQTHNSVVSTLLALLDGLKSRGSVVVIGATNRPDAIDPALRRPGRFDREIYFPLPSVKDREAILSLHTQKWPTRVSESLLKLVARRTVGFAGADLQALCTQTAIIALKRSCQWEKLLTAAEEKGHFGKRPVLPKLAVQERDWLEALSSAPPPCSLREAGMAANDIVSSPLPVHLFPCLIQSFSRLIVQLYLDERVSLPSSLSKAAEMIKTVIIKKENSNTDCWWSRVDDLVKDADVASDLESSLLRANVLSGNGTFLGLDAFNVDDTDEECIKFGTSRMQNGFLAGKKPGFCLLISGNPRNGQRHLASCILHFFVGNAVLQKVDLATMLHEGAGDMVLGLTQMLVRCASVGSCIIFMPRIDLWAIETSHQVDEEENHISSKTIGSSMPDPSCLKQNEDKESCPDLFVSSNNIGKAQDVGLRASDLWSSFVEQAESIFISSSLTILATTEIPFELLPPRIRDFFGKNKQNISPSNHSRTTVPRFYVNIEESFNRDMVINLSATKLLKDVARYFVELIHHKTHIHESSFQPCDITDADVSPNLDSDIPTEYRSKSQTCSVPPNKREEKGKSNLMLAISTFGYQILKYPHFAELCWVTSKLKEGPFAEIDGPWKGWPFNSCIVRPVENSSNVKSKEKYGLVRGLVAVGLSAYRGVYSSLREVSGDVRKVLEILILQINARIEGGKDRYQFARLLSQVAYLEDMVNSWAYTLQSLEAPTQPIETTTKPDSNKTTNTVPVEGEGEDDDCMEENTKTDDIATNTLNLNEDQSVNKSNPILQTQGSTSFRDQTYTLSPNEVVLEHSDPKPMEHCNGFACEEESIPIPIPNDSSPLDKNIDPFVDQASANVCVYRFCSKCMLNLQNTMQKTIISQWDPKSTTEDVDDVITSLSLNLYSTVREFCQSHQITSGMECVCHSESSSGNGVELELIYKNGVVAVLDPETDVDFHCKFEALCLCSLTEYIVMTKLPSG